MQHDQYSYWLTLKSESTANKDLTTAVDMLKKDGTLKLVRQDMLEAEFQVDEDVGTIEEWCNAVLVLPRISAAAPTVVFDMLAIDEDTGMDERYLFYNGKLIKHLQSRIVPADAEWDRLTLNKVIETLEANHHAEAATTIRNAFKNYLNDAEK